MKKEEAGEVAEGEKVKKKHRRSLSGVSLVI